MRHSFLLLILAALPWSATAGESSRPSPAYTIQRLGAPAITLAQYRGKIVALAFIHTTCTHCQQLTTELNLLAKDYTPRGVQFLECAFNEDAASALPGFLQRYSPPFPVGYGTPASVMAYLQRTITDPRPMYVPQMVFLDRAGVIRAEFPGEDPFFQDAPANIRAQLDKMLKAAPATPSKATKKKKQ
ncbi:MAG: TlpA disulfide reductase family protein [Candidatus Solibacter sp.]